MAGNHTGLATGTAVKVHHHTPAAANARHRLACV
jgi:hypothetical protein